MKGRRTCQRGRCSFAAAINTARPTGALERATERSFEKKKKGNFNHRGWRGSCRKSFKDANAERASGSSLESRLVWLIAANSTTIIPNYLQQEVEVALYVGLRVSEVCLIFTLRVSVGEGNLQRSRQASARRSLVRCRQGPRREELGTANRGRSLGVPPEAY